jgi:flagellar hook-length control protein FliK
MLNPQVAVSANKAALPALPSPAAPRSSSGTGPSFAQMLSVQAPPPAVPTQAAASPAPKPAAAPAPHDNSTPPDAAPPPAGVQAKSGAPATTPAKAAGSGTNKSAAPSPAKADTPAKAEAAPTADGKATTDDAPAKPATDGLDEFTSLIGRPAAAALPVDAAAAAAAAQAALQAAAKAPATEAPAPADTATSDTRSSRRAGDSVQALKADATTAKPADAAAGHDTTTSRAVDPAKDSAKALDAAQPGAHRPGTPDTALPSFAASLQAATAGSATVDGTAAATTSAGIASPPQSAAFAPEVATRVSLMAVDGVQHAELQLNPADMGPVAVQIVVDGSQAQVSFHAAHAETRQALEQSLPDLAAALQGQGLTLSGGGVFQQAQQQARGNGDDSGTDRSSGTAGSRVAGIGQAAGGSGAETQAATRRTVGLLDTFA